MAPTDPDRHSTGMGERIEHQKIDRSRIARKHASQQRPAHLLEIVVDDNRCSIGGRLNYLDDLAETSEVGDWKMLDYRMACAWTPVQGWLIVEGDTLTLTTAGLAAG